MQDQLQWQQHSFDRPAPSAFPNNAPQGAVATPANPGGNASGSSTKYSSDRSFERPLGVSPAPPAAVSTSASGPFPSKLFVQERVPSPQNVQQGRGPTVVRLEGLGHDSSNSHVPPNVSSTASNANVSSLGSAALSLEHRPNGENAGNAGSKPVLKMKRTGQNLPLSSELYQRPKSHSPSQSSASVLSKNVNNKQTGSPVSWTSMDTPAVRKTENQTVALATNAGISNPVVKDWKNGPQPGVSKPTTPLAQVEAIDAEALDGGSVSEEDSDGEIKYEKAQPAVFDDVESDASDHETSHGESGSESDGDETAENSETQKASFQQLFQPPDLDLGSDDEDDYSSDDEDEASGPSSTDSEPDDIPAVITPAADAHRQVTYPSTILTKANANRLYTEVMDCGKLVKAGPTIFPDGYEECAEFKAIGRPWICAVRSCRLCYKTLTGLSLHVRFAHKKTLLNDNMDGTVSIVATYTQKDSRGKNPPLVVSKRPLDPTEPPMPKPSLPKKDVLPKQAKSINKVAADTVPVRPRRERLRPARGETVSYAKSLKSQRALSNAGSKAAPKTGRRLRLFSPSEIRPIEMATEDRKYKVITGPGGDTILTCGALLPRNYERDTTIPGYPWICPIRSCRCVFMKIISLGSHFVRQHRGVLLNDNQDGTVSEVGYYDKPMPGANACPALVISQKPLGPSKEPLAKPKVPPQHRDPSYLKEKEKGKLSKPHRPKTGMPPRERITEASVIPNRANSLWDIMLPLLPASHASMSSDPNIQQLLRIPRKRTIDWREERIKRRLDDDKLQVIGLIVHLVGDLRQTWACTNCLNGQGPFKGCYNLPSQVSYLALHCCANCIFEGNPTCSAIDSFRNGRSDLYKDELSDPSPRTTRDAAGGQKKRHHSDAEADSEGSAAVPRRSGRLQVSDDAADREPMRKIVRLSLNSKKETTGSGGIGEAAKRRSSSVGHGRQPLTAAAPSVPSAVVHTGRVEPNHFELEDWEIAPGQIEQTGIVKANNIAFSKPYLERHAAVQVSPDLSFRVETIKSGYTSEIEVDTKNTRYCSVASGKVWVSMDEQLDFTIGTHGMFKIMPGVKTRVQNRLYFDSVLHISTFKSW